MSNLELPHESLMRRYKLSIEDLPSKPRQLKMDLDRTIQMVVNKSRNGQIQMTANTQSKIETYDRYICDGIFEYLEDEEVITESQSDSMESQMDSKRSETINSFETTTNTNTTPTTATTTQTPQTPQTSNTDAKIGFWDWK
jgi:hypothetical protein